ncbi:xylan glycosyltransferase MUCI21-like isoform X1 [Rhododendron vialii]|uniref:xylan glycosyltransferase MUCI21-like isoform X1 n=1 Tax=Rhododendron vialii TaxID=182163 RepID=UPI0026600407|nr:xylan glycosyltransferase MUCI21-like isoform X1 [Rhododendron vialii]
MVNHLRYSPLKKGVQNATEDEESQNSLGFNKITTRPRFLYLLFLSLFSCSLLLAPHFFCFPHNFSFLYSFGYENGRLFAEMDVNTTICSSISNGTICCDRSSIRSDICMMKGDVRTHSLSSSIYLYTSRSSNGLMDYVPDPIEGGEDEEENTEEEIQHENIKPYTRKWEKNSMDSVGELHLISKRENTGTRHQCDVKHDVPAIFFSTSGYTGNIYHEFNDGILPLYITSQHFNKRVVFVISEYHKWWNSKYGDILSLLSDYPPVDFSGDNRTHCFPEAIVGLRIHDELTVDPSLMEGGKSIKDFHDLLDRAYWPRINGLIKDEERKATQSSKGPLPRSSENEAKGEQKRELIKKPKLAILSRKGSRAITNEDLLVKMAEEIGFEVEVLRPDRRTELAKIYRVLNSSDVFVGVHGAGMTHLLFVRPSKVFIQVIPLGTEWAAETYYGEPAVKLGLKYIGYKILPRESSLYDEYKKDDPILNDPDSMHKKGWEFTKKTYLDHQNVRLNLERFRKRLVRAYNYSIGKKNRRDNPQSE